MEWQRLSTAAQLSAYLRAELKRGRWVGRMPGVMRLAGELGIARNTVEAALQELENEGVLVAQGLGRGRLIDLNRADQGGAVLRIAILLTERSDRGVGYMVEIEHQLEESGHSLIYPSQSMADLGMDPKRIAKMARKTGADAWIVMAGGREVLGWFASQNLPVLALFGRRRGLPIAGVGPNKVPQYSEVTQKLVSLGHRRIVLLARTRRRLPEPGAAERAFLEELTRNGIKVSAFNLPHWEETPEGFQQGLEELFRVTPPTAMIIQEAAFFAAAMQFLANRRLRVPQDVSLVCTDNEPIFDWCHPAISHIRWDSRPVVRRIVRWAANVSHGKQDLRQTFTMAEFVTGGTIAAAKG